MQQRANAGNSALIDEDRARNRKRSDWGSGGRRVRTPPGAQHKVLSLDDWATSGIDNRFLHASIL